MVSRLEAAVSMAMVAGFVCSIADWEAGQRLAWPAFLLLLVVFVGRTLARRARGQTWNQAWGREDADRNNATV